MSALLHVYYSVTRKPADHWLGYTVAISGALMQMMTYGIDNSFSIFSESMQKDPTLGYPSATAVSFGNSVSLGLAPVFGLGAGLLVDRLPPRILTLVSTVLLFLALWISSTWAHSMVAIAFSYCLLASISSACMLSPGAAATGSWFRKRAGLAQGINFCGGGVGSAVIPAVIGTWLEPYGWRTTFRLMSAFCAIGLGASVCICRRGEPHEDEEDEENEEEIANLNNANEIRGSDEDGDHPHSEGLVASPAKSGPLIPPPTGKELEEDEDRRDGAALSEELVVGSSSNNSSGNDEGEPLQPHHREREEADNSGAAALLAAEEPIAGEAAVALTTAVSPTGSSSTPYDDEDGTQQQKTKKDKAPRSHVDQLMEELHTRRLTPCEILRVMLTKTFLANFFMFAIYGWAFYGMIYVAVPYVSSMGTAGTVYQHQTPISNAKASTVFTFWGVFQIVGSILVGALASATTDAFAYCMCCSVGGISSALLAFCRSYAAFAACMTVIGFCTAGIFAVMPALLVRYFHGPNLGFFMSAVFVAGCLGGFSSPPIQAQLQTRHHGNYTYGCIFISCCFTVPGVLCYMLLWPDKRNRIARFLDGLARKAATQLHPRGNANNNGRTEPATQASVVEEREQGGRQV